MAEDPWAEKPKSWVWPAGMSRLGFKNRYYEQPAMDAFHEKLKDEIDRLKEEEQKLEAVKSWLKEAKAQGRISMSTGFTIDRILGVEEE